MKYSQIRPSRRRVLIAVIRNQKWFHGSPIRGDVGDSEVSRKRVRIIGKYGHETPPYVIVPNYLIEYKLGNMWPFLETLVVGHSFAAVLVKKQGTDKLPDDSEFAPVDHFWKVGMEIQVTSMSSSEVRCMSFKVRDCGTSCMFQCESVCLTHTAGADQDVKALEQLPRSSRHKENRQLALIIEVSHGVNSSNDGFHTVIVVERPSGFGDKNELLRDFKASEGLVMDRDHCPRPAHEIIEAALHASNCIAILIISATRAAHCMPQPITVLGQRQDQVQPERQCEVYLNCPEHNSHPPGYLLGNMMGFKSEDGVGHPQ